MERRQGFGNLILGNTESIRQHILQLLETDILSCGGRSLTSFGIVLLNADKIHQQSSKCNTDIVSRGTSLLDLLSDTHIIIVVKMLNKMVVEAIDRNQDIK